jgi:hypothetical protein
MLRLVPAIASIIVVAVTVTTAVAPTRADYVASAFTVKIDNPTVKRGSTAVIVATISAREGFRIAEAYRHRIVNLSGDDGVDVARRVVIGAVSDGAVVFRVEVVPKTAGPHVIVGVFRFSVTNGERLDIKAAPFESTVTATD